MDFTKGLTFTFRERDWLKKILITGLIAIIPIIGIVYLLGWGKEIISRVQRNSLEKIPPRPSIKFFKDGLRTFFLILVYSLPLMLFLFGLRILSFFWAGIFNGLFESAWISFFKLLGDLARFIYLFALLLVLPALFYMLIKHDSIRGALEFKTIYLMIKHDSKTFFGLLVAAIISIIISSLGVSVFYIGIVFTLPLGVAVYSYLVGDAGKNY